eukprot:TRINITY_DN1029_c0_g2_i2.p1 TRINITY_DN1029_c0_g2~~TRINITY_DN1029_c0_g2_i2.p1  ORF type:complete len:311 (+),score=39.69 TRINITY_DN1029_c0_g2_i2:154-1086(+)
MYCEQPQEEKRSQKEKKFKFKLYDPQDQIRPCKTPLKFYSTSLDFSPSLENPLDSLYPSIALSTLTRNKPNNNNNNINNNNNNNINNINTNRSNLSKSSETLEKMIGTFEKGPFADEIISFLDPFFKSLHEKDLDIPTDNSTVLDIVVLHFKQYCEQNREQKEQLMKTMNVKQFLIPYIDIDLPGELILTYNELEEDDPQVVLYQQHPVIATKVRELGVFLDRYDTNKEVLCLLVWSKSDNILVNLPSVALNPYPLCWNCSKSFGINTCGRCGVAKYCSRECQVKQWKEHKYVCPEMAFYSSKHKHLYIV